MSWRRCCCLLFSVLLADALVAQRPRTAEQALQKFAAVATQPEASRSRAVRDLAPFADDQVTERLLAELAGAEGAAYLQTVVRALGGAERRGAVPPLRALLQSRDNSRLLETIAEALAAQGAAGVEALIAELGDAGAARDRRNAICVGLGKAAGDAARDALITEIQRGGGRDRLAPLRALASRADDAAVDTLREQLAGDKDPVVAAAAIEQLAEHATASAPAAALSLLQRLGAESGSDLHTAVLRGLLVAPPTDRLEALLTAAARAEDAFGGKTTAAWQRVLADPAVAPFLITAVVQQKSAGERAAAARALALVATGQRAAAATALTAALADRDADVVLAALPALLAVAEAAAARSALTAALQRDDKIADTVLPATLAALHGLRKADADWPQELLRQVDHKRATVRAAALRLAATLRPVPDAAVAAARAALAHKDPIVRIAAIELAVAARTPSLVPELFQRLDREQGRLHQDLVAALRDLTGLQFDKVAEWQAWWQREGDGFTALAPRQPAGKPKAGGDTAATYWNIPVLSDRVAFVVDVSGSMNQPFGTGSATRLDEARRQLRQVLDRLPKQCRANVITFSFGAAGLFDRLQPIDKKRRQDAETAIAALAARGPTNVHDALKLAFADADVDTIFLLTDGHPSSGPIVQPDALAAEVERWNVARGVRIHTIGIGEASKFLERLAAASGGEHTTAR